MRQLTAEELKNCQLELLLHVDKICRNEGIAYSLCAGSLIGTIRHRGYIPWDDDIDIMLERTEYEKLLTVLRANEDEYKLLHYTTQKSLFPFAKLYNPKTVLKSLTGNNQPGIGVGLDIFPMDVLPSKQEEREAFQKEARKKAILLESDGFPAYAAAPNLLIFFAKIIVRFPQFVKAHGKWKEIASDLDTFVQKYATLEEKKMGFVASYYGTREVFPREIFQEYEDCPFEHLTARKIKNHDAYLSALYGDYMQLPPKDKQVNHGYYKWYWKEK
ncbi:lipopolysaccharide cholinephosphotransferase [Pilibacter termitis]|uniref:Lipopolysaccharide cholinephosphotransferase n=1 Tax=Pilibacter termitis TaxID=263852 RepID=A0A1T4P3J5_9ENTE|nr:LicD family protein [Pilibacter termitis]SJZ86190.1 lipopolysaccharide cholinephosphotransferase [Pilibacter termitis]